LKEFVKFFTLEDGEEARNGEGLRMLPSTTPLGVGDEERTMLLSDLEVGVTCCRFGFVPPVGDTA